MPLSKNTIETKLNKNLFFTLKIFNKLLADFCILNPALIIVIFYFQYIIKTKNNKSFALPKLSKKFNLGKLILE